MYKDFKSYFTAIKDRRDEDSYPYTDEDLNKYISWIETCFKQEIGCYKCLEMMWFETDEGKQAVRDANI